MKIIRELKERRFVQYLTVYAAAAYAVLEAVDQLAGNEVLPGYLYPIALTLVVVALPGVAVVSWYHGAAGDQSAPLTEKILLAGIGVLAIGATAFVARSELSDRALATAPALDRLDETEDPRRIAVTYFEHAGGSDAELLAAGLTESLIDELTDVEALHVVSRNGVAPLRGRASFPTDSVGRALGVGTLVRGQVTSSDSLVRVSVDVIDASEDANLHSTRFQRPKSEIFALQDDIASDVAVFLREAIGEEVSVISDAPPSGNGEAWLLVREAEQAEEEAGRLMALEDVSGADRRVAEADSMLDQAERLAPDWSKPAVSRGWLVYQRTRWGGYDREAVARRLDVGLSHAERALSIDPDDADALELKATLSYWRYLMNLADDPEAALDDAERYFNASIAANPAQASALSSLSHLLMNKGATAQAKLKAEQSYRADPWLVNANVTLWRLFSASLDLEDAREARRWCAEGRRRFPDDFRFRECQVWLRALRNQNPDTVKAAVDDLWSLCGEVEELSPPGSREFNEARCQMLVAMALVRAELPDSALAVASRARRGVEVDPVRELAWLEAFVHVWLGNNDAAIERLSTFLAANPSQVEAFARDRTWWLEDIRDDPAYQDLVRTR